MSRDSELYRDDIRQACARIARYVGGMTQAQFQADEKTQDAVIRNLEIIGEATKKLPEDIRQKYPDIDWRRIAGLRDILIHHYYQVDLEILWNIAHAKVPELLQRMDEFNSAHE